MKKKKLTAFILALAAANILSANICTDVWAADPPKAQNAQNSGSKGISLPESDLRAVSEVISEHTFGYSVYISSYDTKKHIIEIAVESKKQIPQLKKAFLDKGVSRKTVSKNIKFVVAAADTYITDDLVGYGDIIEDEYFETLQETDLTDTSLELSEQSDRPGSLSYDKLRSIIDLLDDHFFEYGICEAGLNSKNSAIEVTVTDHAKIPDIKKFLRKKGVSPRIISKNIKFIVVDTYITDDLVGIGDIIEEKPPVGMWTDDGKQYEYENGKYAVGATLIGGVMYDFDENCILRGLYTGWNEVADHMGDVTKNYYIGGKRCAGWQTVDGERYYFFYEGGTAVGDVQIEDKIYIFDDDGRFTGETAEPLVFSKNIPDISLTELFEEGKNPKDIDIPVYYRIADTRCFVFCDAEAKIDRYTGTGWSRLSYDFTYNTDTDFELQGGKGTLIADEDHDPRVLSEDILSVPSFRYQKQLTKGRYRAVIRIKANDPSYSDMEIYSYFNIID